MNPQLLPPMLAALLAVLLAAAPAPAQQPPAAPAPAQQPAAAAAPGAITLPVNWQAGESYRVEIVKERLALEGGQASPISQTTTLADVAVKEKNAEGYVFVWTYGETRVQTANPAQASLAERLQAVTRGARFEMQTDQAGLPRRLLNLDEAVARFKQALEEVAASLAQGGGALPPGVLEQFSRPEAVQAAVLRDPQAFYLLCGASVEPEVTIEYDDTLPNPFGGEPFPSKVRIALRPGASLVMDEATLQWTQEIDRQRAWPLLREVLRRLMPGLDDLPEGGTEVDVRIADRGTYVMNTATGWPREATVERTLSIAGEGRIERTHIRVLAAGPSLMNPPASP